MKAAKVVSPRTGVSQDIAFGQYVVVTARWILVAAGLVLALWNTAAQPTQAQLDQLKITFTVIVVLAFANFYLNLQLLQKRPALDLIAYAASAADLVVIGVLVHSQGGFGSPLFIFYVPALLAISVAFPRAATLVYTAAAIVAYAALSLPDIGVRAVSDQQTLMVRLVMFAAVAFCGQLYYRIEQDRRCDAAQASEIRSAEQEAAEDVFFGQLVIIWARWSVIVTGIVLVLWSANDLGALTANIVLVVALMVMNFYLHGAYAMERPQNSGVVTVVSLLDVAIVTLIVLFFQGTGGFDSPFFVFYYPLILAFALVFPWRSAAAYTTLAIAAYALVCVLTGTLDGMSDVKTLVMRAITLASAGALATYYWRIQRDRRRIARGIAPSYASSARKLSTAGA